MRDRRRSFWAIPLAMALLVACRPASTQPPTTTPTPPPPASPTPAPSPTTPITLTPIPSSTPSPTSLPSHTPPPVPSPTPSLTPIPSPTPTFAGPSTLNLLYAPAGDDTTGRIRGRLFFPSEYVPPLTVYAVAIDGSRFYRVNTEEVPPGEPNYEISGVKPGLYYVYSYPIEDPGEFGGSYSYLAACEAGHLESPPENCWENPQHDLAPVEVRDGQAVEEINIFDWYGLSLPPPPDATGG